VGTWTVQLFNLNSATVVDSATLTLENFASSSIAPVATGKTSYAVSGDALNISARFNNNNTAAADISTTFNYVVLNASNNQYLTAAGTFAAYTGTQFTHTTAAANIPAGGFANDSFTVNNVLFPAAGTYHVVVSWTTPCGAVVAAASYFFPVGSSLSSFADAAFTQPSDLFGIGGTVYLHGPNQLASTSYKIAYYRPDGTLVLTQSVNSDGLGLLTSSATTASLAVSGLWHVVVYPATLTPPPSYISNDVTAASSDSFTLDLAAPVAPTVVSPANGSSTTSTSPTLSGTAEPGSTVTLTITGPGGPYTVITTADGSGNYSVASPVLGQGAYSVSATATDAAGNLSTASGSNGFNVVFFAPALSGPINAGASSISGTSSAADGTTITVYSNGTPIGTTTVTGGTWTLSGVTGLVGGESITATTGTGAATSAASTAIIVTPAAPAISGPLVTGGPVSVGGTSTAPNGSTVTVLVNGTPVVCTPGATVSGGTWSCGGLTLNPGDVVTATVTTNGQTSSGSGSQTVQYAAPGLNGPIVAGSSSVSGTSSAANGTTITVYNNGTPIGTTTVTGGVWTLSGVTGLTAGNSVTATTGTGGAQSAASGSQTVIHQTPAISSPIYPTDSTISGTSGSPDGTVITVYNNGTPIGTTTVTGGAWSLTGLSGLAGNDQITATAGAGAVTSSLSAPVVVAPLPGLLRNASQGTLTPTATTFPRAPGDPSLGTSDRVVFLFASAASFPQESTDYSDQTTPIVFYQLEANSGNTLRIAKDTGNGKLVISY
jgi:hypothetical protein